MYLCIDVEYNMIPVKSANVTSAAFGNIYNILLLILEKSNLLK